MLLPHLLNSTPTSHHEVLAQFRQRLEELSRSGQAVPFVYPYNALGPNLLICYLLIPPTGSRLVYYVRFPLFALIIYLSVSAITTCRSSMVTVGYGIGLLNAWAILWSATLIIFNDARSDFKRIEKVARDEHESLDEDIQPTSTGAQKDIDQSARSRQKGYENGKAKSLMEEQSQSKNPSKAVWQPLPSDRYHRIDWVFDLVSNFRGTRWSYQIPALPPPPSDIHHSLADPSLPEPHPKSHLTRIDLLQRDLPNFILCIIALDVIKTLTLQDPYFWSLPPSTPSPYPYPTVSRLVISLLFVYTSLLTIFLLAPLIFGVLLGPAWIGQHAWPWLYPSYFGPPSQIWQKGIAGLWGGWWHQLFRYAFEQAGESAGRVVGWEKKTQRGMMLRVLVAFACSGFLHACASYSTLGNTRPIRGSFTFFMVQPLGILGQRAVTGWMRKSGLREKIPVRVREIGNLIVVIGWCYLTGPNIADDFAATGIWLYEPFPVSILRGLRGEGWWRWGGRWARWYSAERWWQSGLAF